MVARIAELGGGQTAFKSSGNCAKRWLLATLSVGREGDFSTFIAHAIAVAWDLISSAYCRNALAEAAEYVGKSLPRLPEPQRKPVVETVVLGAEEDRAQLMEALRRTFDSSQ